MTMIRVFITVLRSGGFTCRRDCPGVPQAQHGLSWLRYRESKVSGGQP
jgi:hypothetical protein